MKESGEYDDDAGLQRRRCQLRVDSSGFGEAYLNDEDENGVLGVVGGGIGALEDTSLTRCSDGHGDSSRPCQFVPMRVSVCVNVDQSGSDMR